MGSFLGIGSGAWWSARSTRRLEQLHDLTRIHTSDMFAILAGSLHTTRTQLIDLHIEISSRRTDLGCP